MVIKQRPSKLSMLAKYLYPCPDLDILENFKGFSQAGFFCDGKRSTLLHE
jgi:hypothetical protein